jgi:ribosomal protein S20
MPIIKSAKKRVRVAEKQSIQNSKTKRSLRESMKAFHASLSAKKDTTKAQAEAYSAIDTAVKKGIISKNKAARKKSQLNSAAKSAGTTKPGTKKAKTTPKPATKKAPVKKPAAKKTPTKKPATKKASAKKTPTKK